VPAGVLEERDDGSYAFVYLDVYDGEPVSLSLPTTQRTYAFDAFPAFFDGLLPEGFQLEALLKRRKIDRDDFFTQLVTVGRELVGAVTVEEIA
jgi:serine/threonine-protein kinase HipA